MEGLVAIIIENNDNYLNMIITIIIIQVEGTTMDGREVTRTITLRDDKTLGELD